jgi:hypothetical protein
VVFARGLVCLDLLFASPLSVSRAGVRAKAVEWLVVLSDDELLDYLPQVCVCAYGSVTSDCFLLSRSPLRPIFSTLFPCVCVCVCVCACVRVYVLFVTSSSKLPRRSRP